MSLTTERPDDLRLLDQAQAAELLQVSPRTLEGWRCRGGGPRFVRVGRRVRYRLQDLRAWLDERTVGPTSAADQLS